MTALCSEEDLVRKLKHTQDFNLWTRTTAGNCNGETRVDTAKSDNLVSDAGFSVDLWHSAHIDAQVTGMNCDLGSL